MSRVKKYQKACNVCTSCMRLHHKDRSPSSPVQSFFKVMIDEEYFDTLNLPPKFALSIQDLAGKSKDLENWSGQRWPVTISMVDGSLTFRKGWNDFVSCNGIVLGDFLVFHFINGSHFVVDMYDRTGCIRKDLPKKNSNGNKRSRTSKETVSNDGLDVPNDNSMNEQDSDRLVDGGSDVEIILSEDNNYAVGKVSEQIVKSTNHENIDKRLQSTCKAETLEEPFLEIGTNCTLKHGEDRGHILDISSFERRADTLKDDGSRKGIVGNEISPCHANIIDLSAADKDELIQDPKSRVTVVEDSELEVIEKHNDADVANVDVPIPIIDLSGEKDPKLLSTSEVTPRKNGKYDRSISDEVIKNFSSACAVSHTHSGNESAVTNEAQFRSAKTTYTAVKTEIEDEIRLSSPIAATLTCLIPQDNLSFLELPARLPSISFSGGFKLQRKLVFLRDPFKRLWPVLYYETQNLRVLRSGWEAFCKSNNVQPGDECDFGVESEPEGIYVVRIVQRNEEREGT